MPIKDLKRIELPLPPLSTQTRIAAILSALDDKIELNRQTNATTEAIAQAIFKEWFVDFCFPGSIGEMQDSQLGPIPAKMKKHLVEYIDQLTKGKDPAKVRIVMEGESRMNTNEHQLKELIAQGEGLDIEFKSCRDQLPKSVYETVCAFLNRHGGTLLLGVGDDGSVAGIALDAVDQVRKDFVTAINNPQKLTPPTYLSIDDVNLENKKLLRIYVPESSQVHRCNGRIFDRNEDGDLDITDHTVQVSQLYQRKQATYSENRVYPWIQPGDLRVDLIDRCRRHVRINRKNHPWAELDDAALLHSAQLVQTDPTSGKVGATLAGVMLFGHDLQILQVCPAHRTDLLLRKVDVDRYDDRDLVRTNLEGDNFRMVISVPEFGENPARTAKLIDHREARENEEVTPEVAPEVTPEVLRMLKALNGEKNRVQIMEKLGLKDEKHFREQYLQSAIAMGVIEMTIPDKPRSSKQQYRRTELGRRVLENQK